MVNMFVLLNVTTVNTKRVIVDKDTCEITAVRDTFTSNHSIQLCEFHVTQCTVSTTSSATISRLSNAHIVFYVMWKGTYDCFIYKFLFRFRSIEIEHLSHSLSHDTHYVRAASSTVKSSKQVDSYRP